jgi:hypothetical protein
LNKWSARVMSHFGVDVSEKNDEDFVRLIKWAQYIEETLK